MGLFYNLNPSGSLSKLTLALGCTQNQKHFSLRFDTEIERYSFSQMDEKF